MDPNRLTQNSQQALHDAHAAAVRFGHTEVDVEHLLLAIFDEAKQWVAEAGYTRSSAPGR